MPPTYSQSLQLRRAYQTVWKAHFFGVKVKKQIEEDRAARRNNGGLIKKSVDSENSTSKSPVAPVSVKPAPDQCRIRIQFPDGTKIQNAFKSSETLAAVRCFVEEKKRGFRQKHLSVFVGLSEENIE